MNHPNPDHLPPSDDPPDDALHALIAQAGSLPTLRPSRDLWPGIAARLDALSPPAASDDSAPTRPAPADTEPGAVRVLPFRTPRATRVAAVHVAAVRVGRVPRLAAAAVALATLSSGATYLAMRRSAVAPVVVAAQPNKPAPQPLPQPSTAAHADPSPAAPSETLAQVNPERAEPDESRPASHHRDALRAVARSVDVAVPGAADYDREIAELRAAVAERHGDLDSATVVVLTRNMRIIDAAIAASRAALAHDPRSPFLGEQLTRSLGQKVELLRTVALLPHT